MSKPHQVGDVVMVENDWIAYENGSLVYETGQNHYLILERCDYTCTYTTIHLQSGKHILTSMLDNATKVA